MLRCSHLPTKKEMSTLAFAENTCLAPLCQSMQKVANLSHLSDKAEVLDGCDWSGSDRSAEMRFTPPRVSNTIYVRSWIPCSSSTRSY